MPINHQREIIKLIFISIILLLGNSLFSQAGMFVSGGYRANYLSPDKLNFVIDRFNQTRSNLTSPMKNLNFLGGPSISAGIGGGQAAIIASYRRYNFKTSGSWTTSSGDRKTTRVHLKANDYGISFGAIPGVGNTFAFGAGLELTFLDAKLLVEAPTDNSPTQIERYLKLGFAPYAQFFIGVTDHIYLYLKPSYTLDARFSNFYALNKAINPVTAGQDRGITHKGKFNRLGIHAGLTFALDFSSGYY